MQRLILILASALPSPILTKISLYSILLHACMYIYIKHAYTYTCIHASISPLHLLDKDKDFLAMQRILNPMIEAHAFVGDRGFVFLANFTWGLRHLEICNDEISHWILV